MSSQKQSLSAAEQKRNRELAYKASLDGYNSRDAMIQSGFAHLVNVFFIFVVLMVAQAVFGTDKAPAKLSLTLTFILAIVGFGALIGLLVALEATTSCKGKLRELGEILEEELQMDQAESYWKAILRREKCRLEKLVKFKRRQGEREWSCGNVLIWAAYGIVLLWILISICSFIKIWAEAPA